MIRLAHLLDRTGDWQQRLAIDQLTARLPVERFRCTFASLHPVAAGALSKRKRRTSVLTHVSWGLPIGGPAVGRFARRHGLDVILAWGLEAAAAAAAAERRAVIAVTFDPVEAAEGAKLLRTIARPGRFAAMCASEMVRRRLIEHGLDPVLAVTVRPGVDFSALNRARRGRVRDVLGMAAGDFMVTVPHPVTHTGGQFEACRAVANLHEVMPNLRLVVPGDSDEVRRIVRLVATLPRADLRVVSEQELPFEQVLANADALLVTPTGDISTTAIAWAMGAGAVVIGTAVYAVAEMISHKVNGLLFKHAPGRSMIGPLARCLRDRDAHRTVGDVARAQAYEVFGVRRYAEQVMQLIDNLLSGRAPADGIADSSLAV